MKKILALLLVLAVVFVSGCSKQTEEPATESNEAKTENAETEKAKDGETSEPAEEKKEPVKTEHIKEAEDIKTGDELTALIEEINDENTSAERKAELLEVVGEFLGGMEGQSVELPKE